MPIDVKCAGCKARYKVVESAAGQRVKCRRCGKPIDIPGEPLQADPFAALADLEKTAPPAAVATNEALIQYRAVMSTVHSTAPEPVVRHGTPISELRIGAAPAGPEVSERRRGSGSSIFSRIGLVLALVALLLLIGSYFSLVVYGIAFIVFLVGGIGMVLGGVAWGLITPFRVDVSEGLKCLFVPFYAWYFFFANIDTMAGPFFTQVAGVAFLAMIFVSSMLMAHGPAGKDLSSRVNAVVNAGGDGHNGAVRLEIDVEGADGDTAALKQTIAGHVSASFRANGIAIDDSAPVRAVARIVRVGVKKMELQDVGKTSRSGRTLVDVDELDDRLDFIGSGGQILFSDNWRVKTHQGRLYGDDHGDLVTKLKRSQWEYAADAFTPTRLPTTVPPP